MEGSNISNDKVRLKQALKILVLSADLTNSIEAKAVLMMHPIRLLETVVYLGEAAASVKDMRADEIDYEGRHISPEHAPILEAVHKAYDATDEAFDKMLDACVEFIVMQEFCQCKKCQLRRQRENADLS